MTNLEETAVIELEEVAHGALEIALVVPGDRNVPRTGNVDGNLIHVSLVNVVG